MTFQWHIICSPSIHHQTEWKFALIFSGNFGTKKNWLQKILIWSLHIFVMAREAEKLRQRTIWRLYKLSEALIIFAVKQGSDARDFSYNGNTGKHSFSFTLWPPIHHRVQKISRIKTSHFACHIQKLPWKREHFKSSFIGPSQWSNEYSSCKGKHQSPINIDRLHVKKVKLPPLKLHNFDKAPNATQVENNGHTGRQSGYGNCENNSGYKLKESDWMTLTMRETSGPETRLTVFQIITKKSIMQRGWLEIIDSQFLVNGSRGRGDEYLMWNLDLFLVRWVKSGKRISAENLHFDWFCFMR